MSDWSHGYDVSVEYAHGFHPELGPDWLDFCVRMTGIAAPRDGGAPGFRYLELGSGTGVGLCLLAAAKPEGEFVGVDFLPEHVAHGTALAAAAGLSNVRFVAADFMDLAEAWPADLGVFDYVALHGIYTWVTAPVRAALIGCLEKATRTGSLVYVSYNSQPGWLGAVPFQHVSRRLKETTGKASAAVLGDSIALFDSLKSGGASIFNILPGLGARVDAIRNRNLNYLSAEYLGGGWEPLWHSQVAGDLAGAGLAFASSATLAETLLPGVLPPPLRDTIVAQSDQGLRRDVQDIVTNQGFRRDIFVRDLAAVPRADGALIGRTPIHLLSPPAESGLTVSTAYGELALKPQAYGELVAAVSSGPKTIDELAVLPGGQAQGVANVVRILRLLMHARTLALGPAEPAPARAAQALNAAVARSAAEGVAYEHLAAAHLGSAVSATEVELMLLDAYLGAFGKPDAPALARGLADRLAKLKRSLPAGAPGREAGQDEGQQALALAIAFTGRTLPRWRALGVLL